MIFFRHFNRTVVEHLRAERRKLQHLVVGDDVELSGRRNLPRVGRVDAVHIGVNLAQVGVHRSRDRHRARVAAAAAQRRHIVVLVDALKARDDDDVAPGDFRTDALRVDALDARAAVRRGGGKARLPAEQGDNRVAKLLDRHREQRGRDLLARRHELVHLALRGVLVDFLRLFDEVVRRIALRGDDNHNVVARAVGRGDDVGDVEQPLGVAHGGTAELLNDQCHRITHSFLPGTERARAAAPR